MVFSRKYIAIASSLLLLLVVKVQDASSSRAVIDNEHLEDGSIDNQLCQHHMGQGKRISKISSIFELHSHFSSLLGPEQAACRDFYLQPLTDLKALLDVGRENVCSPEMMDQINMFHWHYIVGGLSQRWRKASNGTLPEPLKVFFMNYAQEVTEKCKDTLERRLVQAASDTNILADSLYTNKFGLIMNQLSNVLHPQSKIKKHDDFLLFWDQLIDKERRKGRLVEQKADPATGEMVLMSFKVKRPENVWLIQKKCRQELRPVYRQTVLPVMRLISIGYGKAEKHSRKDVAGSELVRNWYAITQLCHLILPVSFYLDKTMKQEQATVLPMDKSDNLPPQPLRSSSATNQFSEASVSVVPVQLDDILSDASKDQIVKLVKSNMKARSHFYRKVYRNVLKMTNGQLKSKLKNLFITKKVGNNKYVLENGETVAKRQGKANELDGEDDDGEDDGDVEEPGALVRHRRSITFGFVVFVVFASLVLALVIYCIYLITITIIGSIG